MNSIDPKANRQDAWENLLSGAADLARDKRTGMNPADVRLDYTDAHTLWRSNDMAAKIVEDLPDEMTRKWLCVKVEDDQETGEALDKSLTDLDVRLKFRRALHFARAYGGAGVLIGANDGRGLDQMREPLNEKAIRSVDYLTVFDRRELTVLDYYPNPLKEGYGEPSMYRLNPRALGLGNTLGVVDVHESRIIRFCGPLTSRDDLLFNQGWGDSFLNRVYIALRSFGLAFDSAEALLADFAQAVFKIRGLSDAVAADRTDTVIQRLKLMDFSRSYLRGIALDAEGEDFERKPTPISGLAELLDRFCSRLSAAADMPLTRLMGEAAKGLNATGEGDQSNWYDQVASAQNDLLRPQVRKLVRILMLAKDGPTKGNVPEQWEITFNQLHELSDSEKADVYTKRATADNLYITNAVVTPEEVRDSRFSGEESEITLDDSTRDAFEAVQPVEGDPNTPRGPRDFTAHDDPEAAKAEAEANKPEPVPMRPGAPMPANVPAPKPTGGDKLQDTALNGAQVASALEIVTAVAEEKIPRESGVAMLAVFFNLSTEAADRVMGTVGAGFKPKPPEPTVIAPPGGGKPPAKPKPPSDK